MSGLRFTFNGSESPGQRVQAVSLATGPPNNVVYEPLHRDKLYRLATSEYLSKGKDGYDALLRAEKVVVNAEDGGILPTILR